MATVNFKKLAGMLSQAPPLPGPIDSVSQLVKVLAQRVPAGPHWPPPPTISLRSLLLNQLASYLNLVLFHQVPPTPPLVLPKVVDTTDINPPFDEQCTSPNDPIPPDALLYTFGPLLYQAFNGPEVTYTQAEGRLITSLRQAAQLQDPVEVLKRSAVSFYKANTQIPPDTPAEATALADLAVTGRVAYSQFRSGPPQDSDLWDDVRERLTTLLSASLNEGQLRASVAAALDRAYTVAWAVRDPNPVTRAQTRASLSPSWIAVSGEDDAPDRPVNVASAQFPQFDIPVVCLGTAVRTRCMIALPQPRYSSDVPSVPIRRVPGIPAPSIPPDHEVILFIHGHSSRIEECNDLVNSREGAPNPGPLLEAGLQQGKKYAVVAFDLPSNGYSQMIDHTIIAPSNATQFCTDNPLGCTPTYPLLDWMVEFVSSFVSALDEQVSIKKRVAAVIGGSLGANLALRLGERNDQPWIRNIVAWSPASVWASFNNSIVPGTGYGLTYTQSWMNEEEDNAVPPSRIRYFYEVFECPLGLTGGGTQADWWYRDGWPCKYSHDGIEGYIQEASAERQEIYNPFFRRWHWRVALEQLLFSHWNTDKPDGTPRYMSNRTNTLLLSGQADDDPNGHIYPNTKTLACCMMLKTPGDSVFLLNTGHSIHAERPLLLSQQIIQFLASN